MENRQKSIELLNKAILEELISVHQYMYFHFVCEDRGYNLLSSIFRRTAIDEMGHVEKLAERILFLKGEVDMHTEIKIKHIHEVGEMLLLAKELENKSVTDYNHWAKICGDLSDSASKRLLEDLVKKEEEHYDQFDIEMDNMEKFGDNYLALQSIERSKQAAKGISSEPEE